MNNTVIATFPKDTNYISVSGLTQWDYGQTLSIRGLDLPPAAEVHFSLQETGGESLNRIGVTKDGVTEVSIPDSFLGAPDMAQNYKIWAFVYIREEGSGETIKKICLNVKSRPKPGMYDAPNENEAAIFEKVLQTVTDSADRAEAAQRTATDARNEAINAQTGAETAREKAEDSQKASEDARDNALQSAQNASTSESNAAKAATEAEGFASQAKEAAQSAAQSQSGAENAAGAAGQYAVDVSGYAEEAKNAAMQTGLDAEATAADVQQTGADREAVGIDRAAVEGFMESIRSIAPGIEMEGMGKRIYLDDASDSPLTELTLYGRSEQFTTTGAQLLECFDFQQGETKGLTFEYLGDNTYQVNGTCTTDNTIMHVNTSFQLSAGEYFLTVELLSGSISGKGGNLQIQPNVVYSNKNARFTVNEQTNKGVNVRFDTGCVCDNYTVRYGIYAGSTALPWEPYTGGIPSPSPDYPQEITSVGDSGQIEVRVTDGADQSQSLILSTPEGLCGIPVDSGGNYTDENGQQWVCDTLELRSDGSGRYIRMVNTEIFDHVDVKSFIKETDDAPGRFIINSICKQKYANGEFPSVCNMFVYKKWGLSSKTEWTFAVSTKSIYVRPPEGGNYTIDDVINIFANNLIVARAIVATPIITDLTPAEVQSFLALHTYKPITNITNDADVDMRGGVYS